MLEGPQPNPTPFDVAIPVLEAEARVYLLQNRRVLRGLDRVLRASPIIGPQIRAVGGIENLLSLEPEDPVTFLYTQRFLDTQTAVYMDQLLGGSELPVPQLQTVAQEILNIVKVTTDIADHLDQCCAAIQAKLNQIEAQIERKAKEAKSYTDAKALEVIEQASEEASYKIAGESYYRVISTTTFCPTLIIKFKEDTKEKYPRTCQIKFKIDKLNDEITEDFINDLRKSFKAIKTPWIYYGPMRATYISTDKRFRNILFVRNKGDAQAILKFVYPLLGQTFDEKNLSYTTGRNRAVFNKRKTPLAGIEPFEQDYDKVFKIKFYRVIIRVAGLIKPILIYKAK